MTVLEATLARPDRVERITARARRTPDLGRMLVSLIALVLAGIGWLCAGLWFVATWCTAAVVEGWNEARQRQAERLGDAS